MKLSLAPMTEAQRAAETLPAPALADWQDRCSCGDHAAWASPAGPRCLSCFTADRLAAPSLELAS